jgi:hypothetical protein
VGGADVEALMIMLASGGIMVACHALRTEAAYHLSKRYPLTHSKEWWVAREARMRPREA